LNSSQSSAFASPAPYFKIQIEDHFNDFETAAKQVSHF